MHRLLRRLCCCCCCKSCNGQPDCCKKKKGNRKKKKKGPVEADRVLEEEPQASVAHLCQLDSAVESPTAQSEGLQIPNGLGVPGKQEDEEPKESDVSPVSEPEEVKVEEVWEATLPVTPPREPEEAESEEPAETPEPSDQPAASPSESTESTESSLALREHQAVEEGPVEADRVLEEEPQASVAHLCQLDSAVESPTAQPEGLQIPNGLGVPGKQEDEEPKESDVSPVSEPEEVKVEEVWEATLPVTPPREPEEAESEEPAETPEPSDQPAASPSESTESTESSLALREHQAVEEGPVEADRVLEEEPQASVAHLCQLDSAVESPTAQPEGLQIPNGLGVPGKQEDEEPKESDVSPVSEPEEVKVEEVWEATLPVTPPREPEEAESEEPAETPEPSDQPAASPSESTESTESSLALREHQAVEEGPVEADRVLEEEPQASVAHLCQLDSAVESPTAQPEGLQIPNGLGVPGKQEDEEPKESDVSPVSEPEEVKVEEVWEATLPVTPPREPEEAESEEPAETPEPSDQPAASPSESTESTESSLALREHRAVEEQWKLLSPEKKKKYDREFLLGLQYVFASTQRPKYLPHISDVVLEVNNMPLRPLDTMRLSNMYCGPDVTSFVNRGRPAQPNLGPPPGPWQGHSQQIVRMKEPRKIICSIPRNRDIELNKAEQAWKPPCRRATESEDPENIKTQELFRRVRSILNKLTPERFQQLMKQVPELPIDTEERLRGVVDLIFEKTVSEPNFSAAYAKMCCCLLGLQVPTADNPTVMVNFRTVLVKRCQEEFQKDNDVEIFGKNQKQMDDTTVPEEKARLKEELDKARDKARRRSLGNVKFIGELFKLNLLREAVMHGCVTKLLQRHDEESLERLCCLLTTIGKDLDFGKAKPQIDQYFHQMEKIAKEKSMSSRMHFILQDVIDLRRNNWVPRRGHQGPQTIDQIHKEAEREEIEENIKMQELMSRPDKRTAPPGPSSSEQWKLLSPEKKKKYDREFLLGLQYVFASTQRPEYLPHISDVVLEDDEARSEAENESSDKDPAPQEPPSAHSLEETDGAWEKEEDKLDPEMVKQADLKSRSKEEGPVEADRVLEEEPQASVAHLCQLDSAVESPTAQPEGLQIPNGLGVPGKQEDEEPKESDVSPVSEPEEVKVEEVWEATLPVTPPREPGEAESEEPAESPEPSDQPAASPSESTESTESSLALRVHRAVEGGRRSLIPDDGWNPIPIGKGNQPIDTRRIAKILKKQNCGRCGGMETVCPSSSQYFHHVKKAVNKKRTYPLTLRRLAPPTFQANLNEQQVTSNTFIRALMTSVCRSAIASKISCWVDSAVIKRHGRMLQRYVNDDHKQLQALYALQALLAKLDQTENLLPKFFSVLYDEGVIEERAFYKWEKSTDPAEQQGKAVALKSVTAFYIWLREGEDESDSN